MSQSRPTGVGKTIAVDRTTVVAGPMAREVVAVPGAAVGPVRVPGVAAKLVAGDSVAGVPGRAVPVILAAVSLPAAPVSVAAAPDNRAVRLAST
jgi:hypothetical protein